ncbi:MAG: GH3 auxin-responsive promoter family protein, partial [Bacteroidetes bacterium]|nr:GH3 auxin-responsive promoter family protein [Bacteroidota bacterium]
NVPDNIEAFSLAVDKHLRAKNIYYDDLITGSILQPLKLRVMSPHTFIEYMKSVGKLGGQNKVPRLSNDRKLAEALEQWILKK